MVLEAEVKVTSSKKTPGVITGSPSLAQEIAEIISQFDLPIIEIPYGDSVFETQSAIGEDKRASLVKHLLSLGEHGRQLFRASPALRYISDNEASHKALETIYTGPIERDGSVFRHWSEIHIGNIHNAMGARNRLRIVKGEFAEFMESLLSKGQDKVDVLSVAAGSSRGIMEVLADLNGRGHDHIRLRMVDINREALADGRKLVKDLEIQESVDFIRAHFLSFKRYLEEGYNPHFVEIVGLLDYLSGENIINLLGPIRDRMAEGGVVLFSNIDDNDEKDFTHKVVGWREMQYRPAGQLAFLAKQAGFAEDKIRVIKEPLGIYNLVTAQK